MRIITTGDSLFSSRNLRNRIDQRIVKDFDEADGVFSNAEFVTPKPTTPPAIGRGYTTAVRQDTLDEFVNLNIRLLSFAHNHAGDYGWEGMVDTMEAAHARKLMPLGLGMNMNEARLPKFLDTPSGRLGIVTVDVTRSEVFAADDAGGGAAARPGVNACRWGRAYVLPPTEFEQLRHINEILGTKASVDEGNRIETYPPEPADKIKLGSLYEGSLQFELGDRAYVRTYANESDKQAILKSVTDASYRSSLTILSLHTHEGENENWYSYNPPQFIIDLAHDAIDAGADAVVGHGAHFMRGVEIYKGKPIFYNLGSLLMEFEAGESIITPEMYRSYGYDPADSRPSLLHRNRAKDKDGNFIGFSSQRRFSQNAYVIFDADELGNFTWKMIPLDLGMDREIPLRRGIPAIADPEEAQRICDHLNDISAGYGTKLVYDKEEGCIRLT